MGCLSLIPVNVMFVNNFVYFMLLTFSGANIDLKTAPAWITVRSSCLPLTRGIAATRLLVSGASPGEIIPLLLGELGIGLLYGSLGYILFFWFEIKTRRCGEIA